MSWPVETLKREMLEELDLDVTVGLMLDSWIYEVEGRRVLILTYECHAEQSSELTHSAEHTEAAMMNLDELTDAVIPAGYLASIRPNPFRTWGCF